MKKQAREAMNNLFIGLVFNDSNIAYNDGLVKEKEDAGTNCKGNGGWWSVKNPYHCIMN